MNRSSSTTTSQQLPISGDGIGERPFPELALPDPAAALGSEPELARRTARLVLRTVAAVCVLAAVGIATVPIERTVELDGRLVPEHAVPVRPRIGGLVAEILVTAGDTVAVGDTLARLDGHALRTERAALSAERDRLVAERHHAGAQETERERAAAVALTRAQASLLAARAAYRRTAAVFRFRQEETEALGEGAHVALDEARATLVAAEADVEAARYGGAEAWRESWHGHAAHLRLLDAHLRDLDARIDRLAVRVPSTLLHGAIVLTEDLDLLPHARLDAGDVLLELAGLDADGAIPLVVHASADEREAQRIRPGMPARLTFPAVPTERPRQSAGRVLRVGPAPEDSMQGWRIELAPDPGTLATITEPARNSRLPTVLHAGFSVQIAVEERRETVARTATRWVRARHGERRATHRR